ncbi:MAG: ABC transporter substrate-binding protein [Lachnospiraceae bacterium]|nr:ABC transporter substrate-binding protein [Lachnospiraceae bacterium]
MRRNKKNVALLLALSMLMTTFSSCGKQEEQSNADKTKQTEQEIATTESEKTESEQPESEELEPVTLRIFSMDASTPDDELVEEYINNLPQVQALNVTIDLVKFAGGQSEYQEKIPLLLSTNEQMDIGWDNTTNFTGRIQQGAYADISELVEADSEFYETIPESMWKGMEYNGGIYGVPTYKEMAEQWALFASTEIMEKYNIDASAITDFQDIEPVLAAYKEEGFAAPLGMKASNYLYAIILAVMDEYDFFGGYRFAVVDPQEGKTVQSVFRTEAFAEFIETMCDWYQKGYIHQDVLTIDTKGLKTADGRKGVSAISYTPLAETIREEPTTVLKVAGDPKVTNASTRGSVNVIYEKCENKERAYEFLKLWNTDPEVRNAFYHGVPGVHYNVVDGKAEYVENKTDLYNAQNWTTGNVFISMLKTDEPDDKWEQYEAFNASATEAVDLGIFIDTEKISDKISVINSVMAEYLPPLVFGLVEPESGIEQLNEQLKAAGIDEVIAEFQAQFDAFLASK